MVGCTQDTLDTRLWTDMITDAKWHELDLHKNMQVSQVKDGQWCVRREQMFVAVT